MSDRVPKSWTKHLETFSCFPIVSFRHKCNGSRYNQLGVNTPVASQLIHHKKYSLYFKINFWTWKHFQKGTSFHGVINQTALWTSTHWYFVWNPNTFLKKGNSLPSCSELRFHLPHSIKWQYHIRYFRSIIILKTDLTLHYLSKKKCLSHENFIY